MNRRAPAAGILLAALHALAANAIAFDAGEWRRVPVTDPAERAALGLADVATPLFAWRGMPAPPKDAGIVPVAPGQGSIMTMGSEFVGISAEFEPGRTGFVEELFCPASSLESRARARLPLPSDRRLRFLDVWGHDSAANVNLEVRLFEFCLPLGEASEGELTLVATHTSPGASGYYNQRLILPPVWATTAACSWYLELAFPSCSAGNALRLGGARVLWEP